jgi:hypothetical protein
MPVACQVCSVDVTSVMSVLRNWHLFYMGDWDVCAAMWRSVSNIGL